MLSRFARVMALLGHARARNLLIVWGLIVGFVLAAFTAFFLLQVRADDIADGERELKNLSLILAEEMDRRLQGIDLLQLGLIEHMREHGVDAAESFDREMQSFAVHQDLAYRIAGALHVAALSLHSASGKLINSSSSWPPPDTDAGDRDFIKALQGPNAPEMAVGAPQRSEATGKWTIYFSRRFEGPNGELIGIIVSTILTDYFEQLFSQVSLSHESAFGLSRGDGTLLVRYPHVEAKIGMALGDTRNYDRVRAALDRGVARFVSMVDGSDRVIASHSVGHYPLVITASNTTGAMLAVWWNEARAFAAVTAFLELVIAAAVVLAIRHLRGSELLEAARAGQARAEERERSARALQLQSQRFDVALSNMRQGLCMYDGASRLVVVNNRFRQLFGLSDDDVVPGMYYREVVQRVVAVGRVTVSDMDNIRSQRREFIERNERATFNWELASGDTIAVTHQAMHEGWLTTYEDVTERRHAEARMAYIARHDVLTDLPNRALFREKLEEALPRVRRGGSLALLYLDLDQFKTVNDTLGHSVGDALLRAVAERLAEQTRETDTVARLGGDEFAIVQAPIDRPTEATGLASRLIGLLDAPFDVSGHQIVIGTSIGIALSPQDGVDGDQLLKSADLALYRAKSDGRGVYRLFHAEMDAQMQARRLLEIDLRQALRSDQFELFFQPLVDLAAGAATGLEALLRWRHPERGLVSPSDFIPLAEEIGLILPLGEWVLRQACNDAATWPDSVRVAVNLSPTQFKSRNLVLAVLDALHESRLSPDRLELEITETVMLQDTDATLVTLHQLHDLGVTIALDDFGTGYSSLSYLRRFPFDRIKIDQSFVRDLSSKPDCQAIVRAVAGLSHDLGMAATAEGVETREQLAALRNAGCTEVQGYLFSPPVPGVDVPALLRTISERLHPPVDMPVLEPIE